MTVLLVKMGATATPEKLHASRLLLDIIGMEVPTFNAPLVGFPFLVLQTLRAAKFVAREAILFLGELIA